MNAFVECADWLEKFSCENPWAGTPFEKIYTMPIAKLGAIGEAFAKQYLENKGNTIEHRLNVGHDCLVNGVKTEIKFSLASNRNYNGYFTFNHIGLDKDWEQIFFIGVNGDGEIYTAMFQKDALPLHLFYKQQGGKNSHNDDYMINGKNSAKLFCLPT